MFLLTFPLIGHLRVRCFRGLSTYESLRPCHGTVFPFQLCRAGRDLNTRIVRCSDLDGGAYDYIHLGVQDVFEYAELITDFLHN